MIPRCVITCKAYGIDHGDFSRVSFQHAADLFGLRAFGNIYSRIGNPTVVSYIYPSTLRQISGCLMKTSPLGRL